MVTANTDHFCKYGSLLIPVPFVTGVLTVYRIDADHCSYSNSKDPTRAALHPSSQREAAPTANTTWSGTLPPRGVVYIELNSA